MKQIVGLALACLVLLIACSKDPEPAFTITGFDPVNGAANLYVTINGEGFDTLVSNTKVAFNGVHATVISTTKTAIETVVPSNASTGKITVTINNNKVLSATDFVILPGKWVQKGILPADKGRVVGLGLL